MIGLAFDIFWPIAVLALPLWLLSKSLPSNDTKHLLSSKANAERLLQSIADAEAGKLLERKLRR